MRQNTMKSIIVFMTILLVATVAYAEKNDAKTSNTPKSTAQKIAKRGVDFLINQGQAEDGSFSSSSGSGITSLAATALMKNNVSPDDPAIQKAIAYLTKNVQPDGGIYTTGGFWKNYETAVAILCLTEANRDGEYDDLIANAKKFLKDLQWDESEDKTPEDMSYGGAGYGSHKRPDLSNTAFFIDALKTAGTDANDPALEKALAFVERCQNYVPSSDGSPVDTKESDGGFFYTPVGGGESKAGKTSQGKPSQNGLEVYGLRNAGLRSYGSMTYAGLKSMIYAGLKPDDPRVKAAIKWISDNYTLNANPNMGSSGLYYYYHTFAKTLKILGMDEIVDATGKRHNWREELVAELAARQQKNGSWKNTDSRWLESDPNLVTAYVLLALAAAGGK